jgi:hypothetical protein
MKHLRFIIAPALILLMAFTFAITPVLAHDGEDNSGPGGGDSSETSDSEDDSNSTSVDSEDDNDGVDTEDENENATKHQSGRLLAEVRRHHHSKAEIEHFCVAHKRGITHKFERIVSNSERIKSRIDDIFDKAIAYQQDNGITVDNFDQLVADANTAKTKAGEAVDNLKTVTPSLDCNNVSVASDVAAFKESAGDTRDSLKDYRKAVRAILKALLTAAQPDEDDTEGSTD